MRLQAYALLPLLAAAALASPPVSIDLDPAKTKIEFTLGDVLHTVHGTFKLKSGHLDLNPETKSISGQVIVDASTGDSGSGARDSRMKKNILETNRYPNITFMPTSFEGNISASPSAVTVTGWFEIHGQKHRISIPMQIKVSGNEGTATGKFSVPYVAWGMKNPSTFVLRVNEQVDVEVTAAASVSPAAKGASQF